MEVITGVIVTVLAAAILAVGRYGTKRRQKSSLSMHVWWESVLDGSARLMATGLVVGLSGPNVEEVPRGVSRLAWVNRREARKELRFLESASPEPTDLKPNPDLSPTRSQLLVQPLYPLGPKWTGADGVRVLRVMLQNNRRRGVASPDDLGVIRVEIQTVPPFVGDWRYGTFESHLPRSARTIYGGWPRRRPDEAVEWLEAQNWDATAVFLRLRHALHPREKVRDDLTVLYNRRMNPDPPRLIVQANTKGLLRVKRYRPATSASPLHFPQRAWRWFRKSYRPKPYDDIRYGPHGQPSDSVRYVRSVKGALHD